MKTHNLKPTYYVFFLRSIFSVCVFFSCTSALFAQTPYTLDDLFIAARSANTALRTADLDIQKATLSVKEAISYALPQIDGGLFVQYDAKPLTAADMLGGLQTWVGDVTTALKTDAMLNTKPYMNIAPPQVGQTEHWGYQAAVSLMQPIFTWGKISHSIALARIGLEAKTIEKTVKEREVETQILIHVASLFYTKQIRSYITQQESASYRLLAIAKENQKNSLILPLDVASAEVKVLELGTISAQLFNMQQNAFVALGELTHIKNISQDKLDYTFMKNSPFTLKRKSLDDAINAVQSASTESALLRLQEEAAYEQYKIISSDAFAKPDLALKLEGSFSTSRFFFIDEKWNDEQYSRWNFTAAIAINSTLFSGGRNFFKSKSAQIDIEKAQIQYKSAIDSIEKKLAELDASLRLKSALNDFYNAQYTQLLAEASQKNTEWQNAYSEEHLYLEKTIEVYTSRIRLLENELSYFSDFCLYQYLCGAFPNEYI